MSVASICKSPRAMHVKDTYLGMYGNDGVAKGRADLALGYGANKRETGAIILVVEAKSHKSTSIELPQLLVYMAAVQQDSTGSTKVSWDVV